tara:strand:- start:197 stop:838 length:642 start_codon:yes stop_codon:yes gene_type:complete
MRRILMPVLLVLFFSVTVSAETYIITGRATYADNSQVQLYDIGIDCEDGENDCLKFRGNTAQTDRYGNYTMVLSVNEEDNGTRILLTLRGEEFVHKIDLAVLESSQGTITQNLKLSQYPSPAGSGFGSGCCLLLFVIMAVYILAKTARMLSTKQGRLHFRGYKPVKTLECPKCNLVVSQSQLLRHLVVEHDMEITDAGQLTGKTMRKTWSEEE